MQLGDRMRAATVGGISAFGMILGGCTNAGSSDHSPPLEKRASSPEARTTPTLSATDAVRKSYTEFSAFLARADRLPADVLRREAALYAVEPQLTKVIDHASELRAKKQTTYGTVAVHIQKVRVDGSEALVRDCQDSSKAGLLDEATKKKLSRGMARVHVEASLVRGVDGRWRVRKVVQIGQGCNG